MRTLMSGSATGGASFFSTRRLSAGLYLTNGSRGAPRQVVLAVCAGAAAAAAATSAAARSPLSVLGVCMFLITSSRRSFTCGSVGVLLRLGALVRLGRRLLVLHGGLGLRVGRLKLLGRDVVGRHQKLGGDVRPLAAVAPVRQLRHLEVGDRDDALVRSEEHTSELQSLAYL